MKSKRYAVVVVTYGEVEKPSIRGLWPSSRKIVHVVTRQIVALPKLLIYFLADYRSVKHYIDWKFHRYRSRLVTINRHQKDAVTRELGRLGEELPHGVLIDVVDACYFVPPYLEDTLAGLRGRCDGLIVVPMIPVESAFSCGIACRMAMDVFGDDLFLKVRVVSKLWQDDRLHRIYIDHLFSSLSGDIRRAAAKGRLGLVLVIHGTIVRDRKGNPPAVFTGLEETGAFFRLMREKILDDPRNIFTHVQQGCLNHKAGGEWTSDTAEKALEEFREAGCEAVVMFPYGYFADNSETEYEAKKQLDQSGISLRQYVPCINESPEFARWLALRLAGDITALFRLQEALAGLAAEEQTTN